MSIAAVVTVTMCRGCGPARWTAVSTSLPADTPASVFQLTRYCIEILLTGPPSYSTFQGPVCECDHTGYKGIYCEQGEFIMKFPNIKKILRILRNENVQKLTIVS